MCVRLLLSCEHRGQIQVKEFVSVNYNSWKWKFEYQGSMKSISQKSDLITFLLTMTCPA